MIALEDILQEALILRSFNWCPIPLKGDKRPRVHWTQFQERRPTDKELGRLFALNGVVCGRICGSNGASLVVRDFDDGGEYDAWRAGNHGGPI